MYADRRDVLPHLRLAREIAPDSEHAEAAAELAKQLERIVGDSAQIASSGPTTRAIAELPEEQRIAAYIGQLKDLCCPQMSQPGSIMPYLAIEGDMPSEETPTALLKAIMLRYQP
jgi:hypothetical protein